MYLTKIRTIAGFTHVFCAVKGQEMPLCTGYVSRPYVLTQTNTGGTTHVHFIDCAHRGANNVCTCQSVNSGTGGENG